MEDGSIDNTQMCIQKTPPCFNYGYIPHTLSEQKWGGDGNALDLVDLLSSSKTFTQGEYKVLGVLGLVHRGCLDYKILAIDLHEAAVRGIETLEDFKDQEQGRLNEVVKCFYNHRHRERTPNSKLLWSG